MNDLESRLTDAMRTRAEAVEPADEHAAFGRIAARVTARHRRGLVVLTVAAALAVVLGTVALVRRDDGKSTVNVTTKPSTTASTSTTATTAPEPTIPLIVPSTSRAIWPFAGGGGFTSPEQAAKTFAVDYLGMTLAVVHGTHDEGGAVTDVDVVPNGGAAARTVVRTTRDAAGHWVVIGARADEIVLDKPAADDALASSLVISGRSTAFEAQIAIELRPYNSSEPILRTSAMGGSNGEIGPFSTTITPPSIDQPLVLLVYEADASDRGKMTKATVIPLDA